MSKFLLKWTFLLFAAYVAYTNRTRLLRSLFGIQSIRTFSDSKWAERFMERFSFERS